MIEEKLLANFTDTDRELLARRVLMHGFIHAQDACPDAALRLALTSVGFTEQIYTADAIAAACREDNRNGRSENWRLDQIESIPYFAPWLFIEFASPDNPQETGGCLFEVMPRIISTALDSLPPAERDQIVDFAAQLIENIKAKPNEDSNLTPWETAFTYFLVSGKFGGEMPGTEPTPTGMRLPAFEAFLKLAPENFVYHVSATAFYYCFNCRKEEMSSAKWNFFLDAENRVVSAILPEAATGLLEIPELAKVEKHNRENILAPCLFALTQLNADFHKTEGDNRAYLEIGGAELIGRLRSLGLGA